MPRNVLKYIQEGGYWATFSLPFLLSRMEEFSREIARWRRNRLTKAIWRTQKDSFQKPRLLMHPKKNPTKISSFDNQTFIFFHFIVKIEF